MPFPEPTAGMGHHIYTLTEDQLYNYFHVSFFSISQPSTVEPTSEY
jgi:hypothetical protein